MNVLIVSPEQVAARLAALASALRQSGHCVGTLSFDNRTNNAQDLHRLFDGRPPDVLLADLSAASDCLPLRHASSLLRDAWGTDAPRPARLAFFAPAHLKLPDWPAHADDFVLPPYDIREVRARIRLYAFRERHVGVNNTIAVADIVLDIGRKQVKSITGGSIKLTPREYELLRFFCEHKGKFFTRERLVDLVWGIGYVGGERTVDIHVRRLRTKLPPTAASLLETRQGGYCMAH